MAERLLQSQRTDAAILALARQAELLELTQDAILVREFPTSTVTFWNRGAERLYGWTREEAAGQVTHVLLDTRFPESQQAVDLALTAASYWEGELVHRRRDGSRVVVFSRQAIQRDRNGAPVAILEINTDVTERRRADEERRRSEAEQRGRELAERALDRLTRLQAVTAALSEAVTPQQVADAVIQGGLAALGARAGAIWLLDEAAGVLDAIALSGYHDREPPPSRRAPLGAALAVAVVVRGREPIYLSDAEAVVSRFPEQAATHRAHGHAALAALPLIAQGHVVGGMTLSFDRARDFSAEDTELLGALAGQCAQALERARLYQLAIETRAALEAAMRTRDAFLASASHDLKNPLASIKATAQLMLRRLGRGTEMSVEDQYQAFARIDTTVTRAAGQVDELLDLARLQLNRPLDLERRPTDLVRLVGAIVAEVQQATELHRLQVQTAERELVGEWDERRLVRALSNLLDNAFKYSPAGGDICISVHVEADAAGRWAVVAVQDQGIGIPLAERERIFERFQRATNVEGRFVGTGIGLASVRHIATSHGGSVEVDSEEGVGSIFRLRLPLD